MNNKIKHLEMIQSIINRMAGNLFFLKGWAISIIAALLALFAKDLNQKYSLIAIFLLIIFWTMDGFFLSQERLFRGLYEDVAKRKENKIDFSMDIKKYRKFAKNTLVFTIFSKTLLWFYLPLTIAMISVTLFIK
ncbi:hypothetical protein A2422_01410 [Candidatus Woesebacteria bacterium RIFOXYC1_FULL_31_51]|uniref:Uncharacterized protein n=1 Tax=Candidatus Woesebacteria bacterium GW2011_GWC2_31_9 TaxID=1618586 RepID=A0A0G0BIV7_9BACT|nr:MAG: hypothetical protein UR17_C0001G0734 [Candidatus Woesebacteria bacterium GW2011_GWF1_31_35]KKP22659.1 MAG: hypothetical protein UR11_C0002G0039 [Candidatus Woesebacteria bacterium GW2011_GWC1_30_29]KKP26909.1 MAG: hypothetical protein UR13_C0001G0004 [Candidatus Woesebacteria bacterium GW2011_GWD1_31_12]KKP27184.1 MAG: hypothetical protein UR16_C0006G0073 [Candidatus Woesebacteria bacterium GW2011_GWB1_31_29]KKP30972.1 MAG: hypothetical protein UR21_C0019G0018 [Candidatus Woesebacteria 